MITFFSSHYRLSFRNFTIPKWVWMVLLGAVILYFFAPHFALAQSKSEIDFLKSAQNFLNMVMRGLNMIFWPILLMIGGLFDNEFIFGGQMGETLRGIWVNMRNFVNVIFVLLLVVIAVYNVLGLGDKGGPFQALQLKTSFPKFALALILVNFSFLGAKVVLDLSNVLTTAVISLPVNSTDFDQAKAEFESGICRDGVPLKNVYCEGNALGPKGEAFFDTTSRHNLGLIMAVSFGKLAQQNLVKEGVSGLAQLSYNLIAGIVLYIVYGISFIVLFAVLLVRIAVLWVLVALSPLIALTIVIPQLSQLGGGEGNLGQTFIKHAISPLIMSLFLSIGYMMINALRASQGIGGGIYSSVRLQDIDSGALVTGMADLQQLLASAAVVAVVWTGAGVAAKGTVAEKFSEGLRGYMSTFGKWAAKLPLYLQAIPVGEKAGGPKVSMMGLIGDFGKIESQLQQYGQEGGLFEQKGEGYQKIHQFSGTSKDTQGEFLKYLAQKPGVVRDDPEALAAAFGRVFKGQPFIAKLNDAKTQDPEAIAKALYSDPALVDQMKQAGLPGSDADFVKAARNAPRPRTSLGMKDELMEELHAERGSEETESPEAFSRKQEAIRQALGQDRAAFEALGDEFKISTKEQENLFNDIRNAYKLIPEEARRAFTLFNPGQKFNYGAAKDRMQAIEALGSIIKNDMSPSDTQTAQISNQGFSKEFIQAFITKQGVKNSQAKTFLKNQFQVEIPGESNQ